jgi:VWFA-related protein
MTALYDAITTALERLQSGTREKKALVVISDGGDNASVHRLADTVQFAERSSAVIYAVGIFDEDDPDRNPGILRRLASATGGLAFFPKELSEVAGICSHIASDIRNQYTLAYTPADAAAPGEYRRVRVTATSRHRGKLTVRTRAGYRAGDSR